MSATSHRSRCPPGTQRITSPPAATIPDHGLILAFSWPETSTKSTASQLRLSDGRERRSYHRGGASGGPRQSRHHTPSVFTFSEARRERCDRSPRRRRFEPAFCTETEGSCIQSVCFIVPVRFPTATVQLNDAQPSLQAFTTRCRLRQAACLSRNAKRVRNRRLQ